MTRLVSNGCSYMARYAQVAPNSLPGHVELAKKLNFDTSQSLAISGSCNNRIIRTTLKDSYLTSEPTFYVIGLSFLARGEFPISNKQDLFEGKWLSTQHLLHPDTQQKTIPYWSEADTKNIIELKNKTEVDSIEDRLENSMFQLLSMINDLLYRGHQVLVFRNPEDAYDHCLDAEQFTQLKKCVNIIDGLKWAAIPWQAANGVKFSDKDSIRPVGIRHPLPGEHGPLNNFLLEYIKENGLYLPVL